jgi:hypothetical protein
MKCDRIERRRDEQLKHESWLNSEWIRCHWWWHCQFGAAPPPFIRAWPHVNHCRISAFLAAVLPSTAGSQGHLPDPIASWGRVISGLWSRSYFTTDGQSVSQYVLASSPLWDLDQILILSKCCCLVSVGLPLWREVVSTSCQSPSANIVHRQVFFVHFPPFYVTRFMRIKCVQGLVNPGSVQQIMLHHL